MGNSIKVGEHPRKVLEFAAVGEAVDVLTLCVGATLVCWEVWRQVDAQVYIVLIGLSKVHK